MTDDPQDITDRWVAAEAAADADTLATLIDDDFRGIGPLGFVLDRPAWLRRFDDGLAVSALSVTDVTVRQHDDVAIVLALQDQSMSYRGRPSEGRFRLSLTMHRRDGRWSVLGAQFSGAHAADRAVSAFVPHSASRVARSGPWIGVRACTEIT